MKNTTREQKRLQSKVEANQGLEINNALNKLLGEFGVVIVEHVKDDINTGTVITNDIFADKLKEFNKRWSSFAVQYMRNKKNPLQIKFDAFKTYVNDYLDKRRKEVQDKWLKDINHTISLNTAEDITFEHEPYLGQSINSVATDVLNKYYFNVFNYNELLWIKNTIRRVFGYKPDYPAIKVI